MTDRNSLRRTSLLGRTLLLGALGACAPSGGDGAGSEPSAKAPAPRYHSAEDHLSIVPPSGFSAMRTAFRGQSYLSFVAPDLEGSSPNLVVVMDRRPAVLSANLESFVAENRGALQRTLQGFTIELDTPFALADGRPAWKLASRSVVAGEIYQRNYYFTLASDRALVLTSSQRTSDSRELWPLFDAAVQSLEFEPWPAEPNPSPEAPAQLPADS